MSHSGRTLIRAWRLFFAAETSIAYNKHVWAIFMNNFNNYVTILCRWGLSCWGFPDTLFNGIYFCFIPLPQVVSNFVSNAAKFTPVGGEVKISLVLVGDCGDISPPRIGSTARIRIGVTDSGIGISEEDQVFKTNCFFKI